MPGDRISTDSVDRGMIAMPEDRYRSYRYLTPRAVRTGRSQEIEGQSSLPQVVMEVMTNENTVQIIKDSRTSPRLSNRQHEISCRRKESGSGHTYWMDEGG